MSILWVHKDELNEQALTRDAAIISWQDCWILWMLLDTRLVKSICIAVSDAGTGGAILRQIDNDLAAHVYRIPNGERVYCTLFVTASMFRLNKHREAKRIT